MLDFELAEKAEKEAESLVFKTNRQIDDFLKSIDESENDD